MSFANPPYPAETKKSDFWKCSKIRGYLLHKIGEKRLQKLYIFPNMVARKHCNFQCLAFFVLEHAKLDFTDIYNRFVHAILENTFLLGRYKTISAFWAAACAKHHII